MRKPTHKQRIRQAAALHAAFAGTRNGVSHKNLTSPAFEILKTTLEGHGNSLSAPHQEALYELLGTLTKFAKGEMQGRKVFALSTGLGKTASVISWITALNRLGAEAAGVAVAVSASKVEALCSIKAALLAAGVPESDIGLKHSLGASASLPSTGDADRKYMLVTHQRIRGSGKHHLFSEHKGKPRAVLVYDESLLRSECLAVSECDVRSDLAYLTERTMGRGDCIGLLAYLVEARDIIVKAVAEAKGKRDATTVILPSLDEIQHQGYTELLRGLPMADTLSNLVALSGETLRVALTPQSAGVLWHVVAVPEELKNVLVLDASYPIRKLCHLDPTLQPGSKLSDTAVKRFDNVTIHQMFSYGGRNSAEKSFRESRRENRLMSREIVEVVKGIPPTEGILLFTFKRRVIDIGGILLSDLQAAGIDTQELLPNGKPRITVLRWGDETSLNSASRVENVVLAGILHRSLLDVASVVVGQLDDSQASLGSFMLNDMIESEAAHCAFQAISRGRCRLIQDGQAMPMKVWLFHPSLGFRKRVSEVMTGAKWCLWHPAVGATTAGQAAVLSLKLSEYLQSIPATVRSISTIQAKTHLGITERQKSSFTRALKLHSEMSSDWVLVARSLVRADAVHFGFTKDGSAPYKE